MSLEQIVPELTPVLSTEPSPSKEPLPNFQGQRLLMVINDPKFFISHRLPIAEGARAAGLEVIIATPMEKGVDEIIQRGFWHEPIELKKWSLNPLKELQSLLSMLQLFRAIKPDVVHHSTVKPIVYGGIAARLLGVKRCIHTVSGLGYVFSSRSIAARFLRILVTRLYRLSFGQTSCRVIVQNSDDVNAVKQLGGLRDEQVSRVLGSGIDLEHFHPAESEVLGDPLVLLPARLLWEKGIKEFVDAARQLKARGVRGRFVVAGEMVCHNPGGISAQQILMWQQEGVIEWWGYQKDMATLYRSASVVCLPSYREGLPKALLEAAACGKPIITSDSSGCREIVRHGVNGFLVPPRDSIVLARALSVLLADKELRSDMGLRSRELVDCQQYSTETIVRQTLEVFQEVLEDIEVDTSRT